MDILLARHATRKHASLGLREDAGAQMLPLCETPKGAKRQEAHRTPLGKRASWNRNQQLSRATKFFKP
ncbi:hypothetical protein ABE41_004845 [Fictibacillus arsenicus]|uniref:Uncharacterized protein n=1 Tax=Fictibacillus arsenicus TaxID=255247 RepID=A0A1B1Z1R7_9BACL|nr:hypothetical protein ABE41_004845 [Fictibacillus arsenicus]